MRRKKKKEKDFEQEELEEFADKKERNMCYYQRGLLVWDLYAVEDLRTL